MLKRFTAPLFPRRMVLRLAGAAIGAAALVVAACSVGPSEKEKASEQSKWSGGPVTMVLDTAVERGDLSDEQHAQVEAIRTRLDKMREDKRGMKKELRASVVGIVRAGTTESEDFDRAVDKATAAMQERVNAGSDALKELHALLEPEQRTLVAEGLRERVAERRKQRAEAEERPSFRKAATRLALDATQLSVLERMADDWRAKHKEVRPSDEEIDALIDAFEDDDFADVLDETVSEKMTVVRDHIASAGGTMESALSILSDDQRGLLAQWIEEGPRRGADEAR